MTAWPGASDEPLDVIEVNECHQEPTLTVQRFRRCFNEIERLLALLEVAYDGLLNHHLHDQYEQDDFTMRVGAALTTEQRHRVAFGSNEQDAAVKRCNHCKDHNCDDGCKH